jgi:hypothetical protein
MIRLATRTALALACVAALSGFKYEHHHITEAPVVDKTAPFYGTGLVIGPETELTGVAKRVPLKMRMYKFLMRKGDTQYVPGLRRESDCSLSELYANLADYTIAATYPHFERTLRATAGLPGIAGAYPAGCVDQVSGSSGRNLAGGRLPAGTLFGAGPDFHDDGAIALYLSDGATLTDQHDITIVPNNSNQLINLLAVADLNGDGNLDYAVSLDMYGDGAASRIAILLGDGAGNFGAPSFVPVASGGNSASVNGFVIADFDGDGVSDIVASGSVTGSTGGVVFAKGHGDGTFAAPVTIATTGGFGPLIAADVDGDGKLDVVAGDGYILFGDGAGHFTITGDARFDGGVMAAGDFDKDGHVDLAILSRTGDGSPIFIWRGDGTGHFTRIDPGYPTGYGAGVADLTVTDVDGDGNPDLVVGSGGSGIYGPSINSQGQTEFLLGRGDGTLAAPQVYDNAVLAIADYDRDGVRDLLALDASTPDHGVHPLLNDGQGHFHEGPFSSLGFSFYTQFLTAWAAADFDGDGKADLLAVQSDSDTGTLHIRRGNGDGTFQSTGADVVTSFATGGYGYASTGVPAIADFSGDGKPDVAMLGYGASSGALYEFTGLGDGTLAAPVTIDASIVADRDSPGGVIAADLDGDGKPDLVVVDTGRTFDTPNVPGAIRVYRNTGSGFASLGVLAGGPAFPAAVASGDVNGDGHADLVVVGSDDPFGNGSLYVWLGHGDGTFAAPRTIALNDIFYQSIALADADGDGKLDIVVANCCGLTFAAYARGDGTGNFATPAIMPLAVSPMMVAMADMRGTGHPDLLVLNGQQTLSVRFFANTTTEEIFANGFDP